MKHLFLFTITNVQNFIAQARKTQDLFAGSQLLSDLIDCAMESFQENSGTIIFPDIDTPMKTNRFLGEIENKSEKLKDIGKDVENAVRDKLKNEAQKLVKENLEIKNGNDLPAGFNQQIDQLLDIKWAFVQIIDNAEKTDCKKDPYKQAHDNIEKAVAALKNIRSVKQFDYQIENGQIITGERGRKCSVDGERNVKFYRKTEKERDEKKLLKNKLYIDNKNEVKFLSNIPYSIIEEGEGLSAVSILKRCYKTEENFPSTADICLLHLKENEQFKTHSDNFEKMFKEKKFLKILIEHFQKISTGDYQPNFQKEFNSQYHFSENLNEQQIKNPNQLYWVKRFQDKFIQPFIGNSKNRHYALLSFDIDNLGKWLAGDFIKNEKETKDFHKKLAGKLKEFARQFEEPKNEETHKKIIPSNKGRIIYNGGDDFLALVNLEYLFEVLNELQVRFNKIVNCSELTGYFKNQSGKITISFGIAVAHYKTPLHKVLHYNKELLAETKKKYRKILSPEIAGIGLLTFARGKMNTKTIFAASELSTLSHLVATLQHNDNLLSTKFIFNFAQLFARIASEKLTFGEYLMQKNYMQTEFVRLAKRTSSKEKLKTIIVDNDKGKTEENDKKKTVEEVIFDLSKKLTAFATKESANCWTIDQNNFNQYLKTAEELKKLGS